MEIIEMLNLLIKENSYYMIVQIILFNSYKLLQDKQIIIWAFNQYRKLIK